MTRCAPTLKQRPINCLTPQAKRRGTPLLHKPSLAPLLLLFAPGRTGSGIYSICFSSAQLLSPSLLPGLSPVHENLKIRHVWAELWSWGNGRTPPMGSLLQRSASEYTSGANSGLPTGSQCAQGFRAPKPVPRRSLTHASGPNLVCLIWASNSTHEEGIL